MTLFTFLAATIVDPDAPSQIEIIAKQFGVDWWKLLSQVISFSVVCFVLQKFAYGSENNPEIAPVADLSLREIITLAPLLFGVFWVGLHPQPLLNVMKVSLAHVLEQAQRHL